VAHTQNVPILHWLGSADTTFLARLRTGPIHSPQRQAILRFLQQSPTPQSINKILKATSYTYESGRKML
jgi:Fe2+ or Zn2+ uptake regulation protein